VSNAGTTPESNAERETDSRASWQKELKDVSSKEPGKTKGLIPEYGRDAILAASNSGDLKALTDKQKAILEVCKSVIAALITDGMSDYDKELAIHDWIIQWASYDEEALSNKPDAKPDPDNDNPYGLLINKRSICSGYTSTFKLFMDMVGIECVIVEGGTTYGEDHAWNMVRIDGNWYCVDVTWTDPIVSIQTDSMKHKYFNVTSEFMRETKHTWDSNDAPEATAPKLYHK
jgi:transglutaminase/protease-like cytokinesis protein 3